MLYTLITWQWQPFPSWIGLKASCKKPICKLTCLGNQERHQFENKWQYIGSPQKARVCWKMIHIFSWWRIFFNASDHWNKLVRNHYPEVRNKNKSKLISQLSLRRTFYCCPKRLRFPFSRDFQNLSECIPMWPALCDCVLAGELG